MNRQPGLKKKQTPEEAKINAFLAEIQKETGTMPLLVLGNADGTFNLYSTSTDIQAYVADLYDCIFPSLADEVLQIEKMGTELLRMSYAKKDIEALLKECETAALEAPTKEQFQNILFDAIIKIASPNNRRKKKDK